ncbi:sensor histidine kinase [Singulisphaera rosea]
MHLNAKRIEGAGDRSHQIILAIEDQTRRILAESQAAVYAAELERSNRELEEFASIASHDLQEPLRKIRTFGDRLEEACGPVLEGKRRDELGRMLDAARRMQALIDDLLAYGRIGSATRPIVRVDLGQVGREVLRDLEVQVSRSGGSVELGPLPVIEAEALQMRQLLQNLIGNALKFRREGIPPLIRIRGTIVPAGYDRTDPRRGPVCCVTVEDNGIGFDPKHTLRIFQLYERLNGRGEYEGTGMGLAITREIVECHGGSIAANGVPGQGATFVVTLPVRATVKGK